jgi:catechol 2,3-dioxygenase-like lactoylglutathione lyase family enzyme
MKVGIFILYVRDVAASTEFYTRLGLRILPELTDPNFTALHTDEGSLIGLENVANASRAREPRSGGFELGFEVADLAATRNEWAELGVTFVTEIEPMPGGESFIASDPDGHYLSVYSLS